MGVAVFYHLTRSGPEETLNSLLTRALQAGWSVMIRSPNAERLTHLDNKLWLEPEDGFLPHGREDGPEAARQPVLLGAGPAVNGAKGVALLDGADALPGEEALERLWVLFDGNDPTAVQTARSLWTRLTAAGMAAQYWSEESGRWEMKVEKKPNA